MFLFGVWALAFAFLFHWLGPKLWKEGISWWHIFHWLLILPLACMLVAAFLGAAVDLRPIFPTGLKQRLRLCAPSATAWLWAPALSGFMHGGNWADLLAVAGSWFALWKEKTRQTWCFAAMLTATLVKRNAGLLQRTLQSIRFFVPSAFYREFWGHFGPKDLMGVSLQGAWWILVYYALVILVFNIGGEELWWRVMCCHVKNWHSGEPHGLCMECVGLLSTCSCSQLSGIRSAWQSQGSRFPLLHNAQKAHGRVSSATVLAIYPSS